MSLETHARHPAQPKPSALPRRAGPELTLRKPRPTPEGELRGKALIFWDPKRPGQKLDAIDTDQITPAKDCVSESLDSLDEKWKLAHSVT